MCDILQFLEVIEAKCIELQQEIKNLQDDNDRLYKLLNVFEKDNLELTEEIAQLKGDTEGITLSSGLKHTVEDKERIKLKVDELVKEVESCIHQLSRQ